MDFMEENASLTSQVPHACELFLCCQSQGVYALVILGCLFFYSVDDFFSFAAIKAMVDKKIRTSGIV
jgi:hypothetical protein